MLLQAQKAELLGECRTYGMAIISSSWRPAPTTSHYTFPIRDFAKRVMESYS